MKIRKGFVSNSSSSSYMCDVCNKHGEMYEGYEEVGLYACTAGHTFCEGHLDKKPEFGKENLLKELGNLKTFYGESSRDWWRLPILLDHIQKLTEASDDAVTSMVEDLVGEYDLESRDEVSSEFCPVCNMSKFNRFELLEYVCAKICRKVLEDEIRARFGTYTEFKDYIRENKGS